MAPLTTVGETIDVILNDVCRVSVGAAIQLDIDGLMETGDLLQGSSANAI
jgi:hypothetical protein